MAINFSALASGRLFGRVARWPLRLIPRDLAVPVLQGPLAGKRWIVGSSTHGCWLGSYEFAKQRAFAAAARDARVVFDVGANVGLFSLVAAVAMRGRGQVVAFEPLGQNVSYIERHVRLNRLTNVQVVRRAVADASGRLSFRVAHNSAMGSLSSDGTLTVDVVTLDALTGGREYPDPDLIKIDAEGAEARVLAGAEATIRRARPVIFLATHGPDLHERCLAWLTARGYRFESLASDELVARPR
jgi:FkbM family methyltransferase